MVGSIINKVHAHGNGMAETMLTRDKTTILFNKWSLQGKDKEMEKEHNYAVMVMLSELKLSYRFDFLDVGCGNGWTVREVTKNPMCKSAWGIDVSDEMVKNAKILQNSGRQHFLQTDFIAWKIRKRFDVILSMEALYYIGVESAVKKIHELLKEGGRFLCGVDYYLENKASHSWSEICNVRMDLLSSKEWIGIFRTAGFKNVKQRNILYPATISIEKWKQKFGTLFTQGIK
jgi:cyclopropane fatty-acyl-phospholipid synthase-like methyltransferase